VTNSLGTKKQALWFSLPPIILAIMMTRTQSVNLNGPADSDTKVMETISQAAGPPPGSGLKPGTGSHTWTSPTEILPIQVLRMGILRPRQRLDSP
jgi:hypothetical protein